MVCTALLDRMNYSCLLIKQEHILESFVLLAQFLSGDKDSTQHLLLLEIIAVLFALEQPHLLFSIQNQSSSSSSTGMFALKQPHLLFSIQNQSSSSSSISSSTGMFAL